MKVAVAMHMTTKPCGLLVPLERQNPTERRAPKRPLGPLEIISETRRKEVAIALCHLRRAMGFDESRNISLPDTNSRETLDVFEIEWRALATKLLGPDVPDIEVKT